MDNIEYLKKYGGGALVPEKKDTRNYKYGNIASATMAIEKIDYPTSFRLWTPKVKNQQDKGTCVAHSMATIKEIQEYYDTGLETQISTMWYYGYRLKDHWQGEGMYATQCLEVAQKVGGLYKKDFPENFSYFDASYIIEKEKGKYEEEAKKLRIKNYVECNTKDEIKRAIYVDKSPILITMTLFQNFANIASDGILAPLTVEDTRTNYGSHAMVIVGWTVINRKEYWVVQNSWGENWGANGFLFIPIDYVLDEKYATIDVTTYEKNMYDITGRWSENYIKKCIRAGLINGDENGNFRPTDPITREQICVILSQLIDKLN